MGCICYCGCHVCWTLPLVCYSKLTVHQSRTITYKEQYNFLSEVIAEPAKHPLFWWLLRLAFIGFCASIVSDSISNSLRVVKTYRQVNDTKVSYGRFRSENKMAVWFRLTLSQVKLRALSLFRMASQDSLAGASRPASWPMVFRVFSFPSCGSCSWTCELSYHLPILVPSLTPS